MKFMRNGLLVLTLLSLCSEMFAPHGGGHGGGHGGHGGHGGGHGGHSGRGGRGWGGHGGRGWGGGWRRGGIGIGLGTGLGIGIGYGGWRYGGWNNWNRGWWNTSPNWYSGSNWSSLSLNNRLDAINEQIATLEREEASGSPDATAQLNYLRQRRDQLARQL